MPKTGPKLKAHATVTNIAGFRYPHHFNIVVQHVCDRFAARRRPRVAHRRLTMARLILNTKISLVGDVSLQGRSQRNTISLAK